MAAGRPDYTSQTRILGLGPAGTLITLAVDASGNLVALVKGTDGVSLHTVAVDSGGQIIMVPRGQSGNYMAVDASGNLTTIMKGVDGVTLRTVAVDASGNIIGLLKGDYAGALKTLAVDAQGRMLAVLTDPEDVFGNPHYMGAAELAVRLGATSALDRLGNVIWQDSFEGGLNKWEQSAPGTGGYIRLNTAYVNSGKYSAELCNGSDIANFTHLFRILPYPVEGRVAVEFRAKLLHDNSGWIIWIDVYTGADWYQYGIKYDPYYDVLYFRDSSDVWSPLVTGLKLRIAYGPFHYVKLVVDLSTHTYTRLRVNAINHTSFITGPYTEANTEDPGVAVWIGVKANPAGNAIIFVDDVIVTQNEPAN